MTFGAAPVRPRAICSVGRRPSHLNAAALCLAAAFACQPLTARADDAAADCAALWQALAEVYRAYPGLGVSPQSADDLAARFRAQSTHEPDSAAVSGYRLMHRAMLGGDRASADLFERRAAQCDALLKAPEPSGQ